MSARKPKKSLIFLVLILFLSGTSFSIESRVSDEPGDVSELLKIDSVYQEAKSKFDGYAQYLYDEIDDAELNYESFNQGLTGYLNLEKNGELDKPGILTIIDFTKPSNLERFFIIDLNTRTVLHKTLCAHGVNSGGLYAKHFSNENNSKKSSLGFYVTTTTYTGKYKLALRISGKEHSNSHANSRGVVIHGAKYATYEFLEKNGCRLGRSHGCPALPYDNFEQVVEWIKEGTALFIYYPSKSYQRYSKYLNKRDYLEEFVDVAEVN